MKASPPQPPVRTREAAFTSAAAVLIAAGILLPNGWPLTLGGMILLLLAVSQQV